MITLSNKLEKHSLLIIFILVGIYSIFFSFYTIIKYNLFHTSTGDLAIFNQIFWNIMHHGTQNGTLETSQVGQWVNIHKGWFTITQPIPLFRKTIVVNHLGIHFSLIFYLLAPFYALFPSPKTLLILQSFAIGLAALPLYCIAKNKTKSQLFSYAIVLSYLLSTALHNVNTCDFHEVAFAPLLILSTLYFLENKRYYYFWIFFVLSLLI